MSKFNYQNREFGLTLIKEGTKLQRVVISDGGLEFPFTQGGYDKAADFLVDEYGGTKEEALKVLNETESLEGLEVTGAPAAVDPQKGGKKSGKKSGKKEEKKEEKAPKEEKKPKEVVERTFNLGGDTTKTKKLQVKTILPDQKPESTQDVKLDDVYGLHIDIYSKKNRTTTLYAIKEGTEVAAYPESVGEVILGGVSLMDVIYAYAEKRGMSFPQADKYIKIKRGLLPEPEPKKSKEKKDEKKEEVKTEGAADTTGNAEAGANTEAGTTAEAGANTEAQA